MKYDKASRRLFIKSSSSLNRGLLNWVLGVLSSKSSWKFCQIPLLEWFCFIGHIWFFLWIRTYQKLSPFFHITYIFSLEFMPKNKNNWKIFYTNDSKTEIWLGSISMWSNSFEVQFLRANLWFGRFRVWYWKVWKVWGSVS